MTRLIDADELVEKIESEIYRYWNGGGGGYYLAEDAVKEVEAAPTVEAVEVVRCKDCLWANTNLFANELGIVYCNNYGKRKKQDDFCSEGERRGD